MGDSPNTREPGPEGGKPVGLASRAGAATRPAASSHPSLFMAALPLIILALVTGLGIGLAVGFLAGGSDGEAAPTTAPATSTSASPGTTADGAGAYGVVGVSGDPLPVFQAGQADTALGLAVPEITGEDFAGNSYSIARNGRPKLIVALAHWCGYSQQALPTYSAWYADWQASGDQPDEVEVYLLTVFTTPDRGNFPPSTWLEAESWTGPVLADDQRGSLATALGIASVPYNLLVAPDGTVEARVSGGLSREQLDAVVSHLAGLTTSTTTP